MQNKKSITLLGLGLLLIVGSCSQKQAQPQPASGGSAAPAYASKKKKKPKYRKLKDYDPCKPISENCIEVTVAGSEIHHIGPAVSIFDIYKLLYGQLKQGSDGSTVITEYSDYFVEVFGEWEVEGILDGTLKLSCNYSTSLDRYWFIITDPSDPSNPDYYGIDIC